VTDLSSTPQPVFQIDGLCCFRDEQALFLPVDLSLRQGELILIEGDNGVGKTTLLRALLGAHALQFDAFKSTHAHDAPAWQHFRDQCAWLGHASAMKSALSVWQNWQFYAALFKTSIAHEQMLKLAVRVGLAGFEEARFGSLSAGQKKRAQLATVLISQRSIWLMDEPFANLDRTGIALIETELKQHLQAGGIALATSHGVLPFQIPHRLIRLQMAALQT
jgi:heme exporter protein A